MESTVTIDVEERRKDKVKNTRIHDKPTHSVGGGAGGAVIPVVLQLPLSICTVERGPSSR